MERINMNNEIEIDEHTVVRAFDPRDPGQSQWVFLGPALVEMLPGLTYVVRTSDRTSIRYIK